MRVCLDTNVLIAAFAARGLCADVLRSVLTEHDLVLGEVILEEFRRVLKSKLRVPPGRIESAEAVFSAIEILPKPDRPAELQIRDRTDRWIVATALLGNADVLVTGDRHLLDIAEEAPLRILSPREFWTLLRGGSSK